MHLNILCMTVYFPFNVLTFDIQDGQVSLIQRFKGSDRQCVAVELRM